MLKKELIQRLGRLNYLASQRKHVPDTNGTVEDYMSNLELYLKYLLLDVEATKRERDALLR